jgi:biopolymer transport protein ExbD
MSFSTAGGGPSAPQMNVTPLIDVLLVLLIIFMLVVIQEKPKGFEAQIPQEPNPKDHYISPPETTIIIQVRDGKSATIRMSRSTTRPSHGMICVSDWWTSSPSVSSGSHS